MPTQSGTRFQSNPLPIPNSNRNESNTRSFPGEDVKTNNWAVLVVHATGATQYMNLLLEDVFDVDTGTMAYDAYIVIVSPMPVLAKYMINGKPNTKYTTLVEAICRKDVDMYLRGTDDINIAVG
jgi:hypothetical protein